MSYTVDQADKKLRKAKQLLYAARARYHSAEAILWTAKARKLVDGTEIDYRRQKELNQAKDELAKAELDCSKAEDVMERVTAYQFDTYEDLINEQEQIFRGMV